MRAPCFFLVMVSAVTAFSPSTLRRPFRSSHFAFRDDGQEYYDALAHNKARTDVLNFLTQRAIQSFMFLLVSVRDPHTVRWLETTYDLKNMEHYHGTGAFNLTLYSEWDSALNDMLQRPADVVIVSARSRGRGSIGGSKNNPYLQDRFVDFEINIDPISLVSRIMSVREQVANEWVSDLDTLVAANDMVLTSYHHHRLSARDGECLDLDETTEDCVELENLISPYSEGPAPPAFDRTAMLMLSNAIIYDESTSSPYRKGSFDLLCLLATQESIHRVLREYRSTGEEREVSYAWLRKFYIARLASHFDGQQEYGRADDFLEELLMTAPSTIHLDSGTLGLIDPLRIAEDVISMRSQVAADWKETVANVPTDHEELRKGLWTKQMDKQMVKAVNPSPSATTMTESSTSNVGEGVFE